MDQCGNRPFHKLRGMNPAVFDAVFTAFAKFEGDFPLDLKVRFDKLVKSKEFENSASFRTTDAEAVAKRLELARTQLFE